MQAWGVSLIVHVVILSALGAATFTSQKDTIKKIVNFDSTLASYSNGEPEVLPLTLTQTMSRATAQSATRTQPPRARPHPSCSAKMEMTALAKKAEE